MESKAEQLMREVVLAKEKKARSIWRKIVKLKKKRYSTPGGLSMHERYQLTTLQQEYRRLWRDFPNA